MKTAIIKLNKKENEKLKELKKDFRLSNVNQAITKLINDRKRLKKPKKILDLEKLKDSHKTNYIEMTNRENEKLKELKKDFKLDSINETIRTLILERKT